MNRIGPESAVEMAHRMGVESELEPVLSLPLGVANVKPIEMAAAFSCFPRGGDYMEPVLILKVYDRYGVLLEDHTRDAPLRMRQAVAPRVARTMVLMMQRVVTGGTGTSARFRNGEGQLQPAGGKTGTTDDYADAWFVGYTPKICTAVWFGNDDHRVKMRRVFGATIPAPTWKEFMAGIYKDRPMEQFVTPPGAENVSIPGASVRKLASLDDIQAEGTYAYPFKLRVEDVEEDLVEEEEAGEESVEAGEHPGSPNGTEDRHRVYF